MKHLKIFEDYFGGEYINKKDLEFFEDIFDYIDEENWQYRKDEFDEVDDEQFGQDVESFIKQVSLTYDSGKDGKKSYNKNFEIIKTSFVPKSILDTVKKPIYEVKYDDQILELPQEKIKAIFDNLYQKYLKKEAGHAKKRRKGVESERENDLKELLGRKAKKYNL